MIYTCIYIICVCTYILMYKIRQNKEKNWITMLYLWNKVIMKMNSTSIKRKKSQFYNTYVSSILFDFILSFSSFLRYHYHFLKCVCCWYFSGLKMVLYLFIRIFYEIPIKKIAHLKIWLSNTQRYHKDVCGLVTKSCPTLCELMDCHAPLSIGFLRQEYSSGLPFLSPHRTYFQINSSSSKS